MTSRAPRVKGKGLPLSHEASNCFPVEKLTPTYWTVTCLPVVAAAPVPTIRSFCCSAVGGFPDGTVTLGLVPKASPPLFLSLPQAAGASARTAARVTRRAERAVRCMWEEANPTRRGGPPSGGRG